MQPVTALLRPGSRVYVAIGLVAAVGVLFQMASLDGWQGVFLPLLSESSETVYALGYSYFGFRRLRIGMTTEEVRDRVGEPLHVVSRPNGRVWTYSDSPVSRSYRLRAVIFDSSGRVAKVVAEFEFD